MNNFTFQDQNIGLVSQLKSSFEGIDDNNFNYLGFVIGFLVFMHIFEFILDLRQLKALYIPEPPQVLQHAIDAQEFKKSQAYNIDKWYFNQVQGWYSFVFSLYSMVYFLGPYFWRRSGEIMLAFKMDPENEIIRSIVFVFLQIFLSTVTSIPWSYYSAFVIEQKHGFNKQTKTTFFLDIVKELGIEIVLVPPILAVVIKLVQFGGPFLALYLWVATLALSLFLMTIYPTVIAPLFNKYTPLEEGELRSKIEALAQSLKFPLKKLFVVDGSTRSAHSNAYMYGFFNNKRIVLYDTLIEQCSKEQVVAVLAHELGHWKLRHTPFLFVMQQVIVFMNFAIFTLFRNSKQMFHSFGYFDQYPIIVALFLFSQISSPLSEALGVFFNVISRRFEFQADNFAVSLNHSEKLKEALISLQKENKSPPNVDSWFATMHYSHPTLPERLNAINKSAKKQE